MTYKALLSVGVGGCVVVAGVALLLRSDGTRASPAPIPPPSSRPSATPDLVLDPSSTIRTSLPSIDPASPVEWREEAARILLAFLRLRLNSKIEDYASFVKPLGREAAREFAKTLTTQVPAAENLESLLALSALRTLGPDAAGTEQAILDWASGEEVLLMRHDAMRALLAQDTPSARDAARRLFKLQLQHFEQGGNAESSQTREGMISGLATHHVTEATGDLIELADRARQVDEPEDADTLLREQPAVYAQISKIKWTNVHAEQALAAAIQLQSPEAARQIVNDILVGGDPTRREIALKHLSDALRLAATPELLAQIKPWVLERTFAPASAAPAEVGSAIAAAGVYGRDAVHALLGITSATLSATGISEEAWINSTAESLSHLDAKSIDTLLDTRAIAPDAGAGADAVTLRLLSAVLKVSTPELQSAVTTLLSPDVPAEALILLQDSPLAHWRDKIDVLRRIARAESGADVAMRLLAIQRLAELAALRHEEVGAVLASKRPEFIDALVDTVVDHRVTCSDDDVVALIRASLDRQRAKRKSPSRGLLPTIERLAGQGEGDGTPILAMIGDDAATTHVRIALFRGLCERDAFGGSLAELAVSDLAGQCQTRRDLIEFWTEVASELGKGTNRWWIAVSALRGGLKSEALLEEREISVLVMKLEKLVVTHDGH